MEAMAEAVALSLASMRRAVRVATAASVVRRQIVQRVRAATVATVV